VSKCPEEAEAMTENVIPVPSELAGLKITLWLSIQMKLLSVPWFLLNRIIICVKVLLNLRKLLKVIRKMHDLCKTIFHHSGYKDINLLLRGKN
jgi:hypothetical protein